MQEHASENGLNVQKRGHWVIIGLSEMVFLRQQELVLHSQLKTFFTQPSTPDFTGLLKILDPIGLNLSVPV